jgi:hypothetical protein
LGKPANHRCKHQTRRGCAIYERLPELVPDCRLWSCQWLVDPDAGELHRPDRVHYVIDIMPDFIGVSEDPTGNKAETIQVMQVWVDPAHPDAWRSDPALRRFMEHIAQTRGQATLIRIGQERGIAVFPPCLMNDRQWHEKESDRVVAHGAIGPSSWKNPMDAIHQAAAARRPRGGL